ncbi:hypothetical protein MOKP126_43530 [Mycobacterium avium subsp. hominissuis]
MESASATRSGAPGLVRRLASLASRTETCSDSGIPNNIPITRIGIIDASSAMMSKLEEPTSGSRHRMQYCRIWSSSAAIRRGVNTRDIRPRSTVCSGGSWNIMTPPGMSNFDWISSRMSLRRLENTCQFASARSTSECRDSAQKSYRSL